MHLSRLSITVEIVESTLNVTNSKKKATGLIPSKQQTSTKGDFIYTHIHAVAGIVTKKWKNAAAPPVQSVHSPLINCSLNYILKK